MISPLASVPLRNHGWPPNQASTRLSAVSQSLGKQIRLAIPCFWLYNPYRNICDTAFPKQQGDLNSKSNRP